MKETQPNRVGHGETRIPLTGRRKGMCEQRKSQMVFFSSSETGSCSVVFSSLRAHGL